MREPLYLLPFALLVACGGDRGDRGAPQSAPVGQSRQLAPLAEQINAGTRAILPKRPSRNWVFDAYTSATSPDVAWSRFWTKAIDFSGVAWDKPQTLTLVSPRHAVMARHYRRPPKAQTVLFHGRDGREVRRKIVGREELPGDIAVVILDQDVPDTVKTYRVLAPSDRYVYGLPGAFALVTDRERKVHVHEVKRIVPWGVFFTKAESLDEGFYEDLVPGDSGNPSFVWLRGEPVLIETHSIGGAGAGPFYGAPENVDAVNIAMRKLSEKHGAPAYQLRTVSP